MRKNALISGIISTFLIFIGIVLRIFHLPGSSLFIILSIAGVMVYFLPVLLIHRLKSDATLFQKRTSVFGCIIAWMFLLPGLLFSIQRWPGGYLLFLVGFAGGVIFLALFFLSRKKAGNPVSLSEPFTLIITILFLTLFVGRFFVRQHSAAKLHQHMIDNEAAMIEHSRVENAMELSYGKVISDTADTASIHSAQRLYHETSMLLQYINEIRGEVVAHSAGVDPSVGDTLSVRLIYYPADYDTPTHYLIGDDPANVTGKAKELKAILNEYLKANYSNDKIKGVVPADVYSEEHDKMVSWEWYNFYHRPIVVVLTTLLKIQTAVLRLEKQSLEEKSFIQKK